MTDDLPPLPLWRVADAQARRAGLEPVPSPTAAPAPKKARAPRRKRPAPAWSASVHVFPIARRRDFVARHAARMAELSPRAAEKHLETQMRIQRETMQRRGVAPDVIDRELASMAGAIRAALIGIGGSEGGAA
ncbi:DUF6074 family protein [Salinarimonas chemoclinalis]|uniref:DUF6074 family protein n=1 Tax=Salinarimonas chemoclinalis TaxID=3241599 RepID=UPI003556C9DD